MEDTSIKKAEICQLGRPTAISTAAVWHFSYGVELARLNRRGLLAGAAATAACVDATLRQPEAPTARVSARGLVSRESRALVAAVVRQHPILDNFIVDTINNSLNARLSYNVPALTDISDITLAYPGWANSVEGEVDLPVSSYTVTAAIEYPAGKFYPASVNGGRTLTVTAGRALVKFDPLPVMIPAGAQFFVKSFAQWAKCAFWLNENGGNSLGGVGVVWCSRGIGLTDQTLTTTTFKNTVGSFGPLIYGRLASQIPVVGIIGDSISVGAGEEGDPITQSIFLDRAMRAQIPALNLSQNGNGFSTFLRRSEGCNLATLNTITHAIISLIRNDLQGLQAVAIEGLAHQVFNQFIRRGVKVWAVTAVPTTSSTDGWATKKNQTVTDPVREVQRLVLNTWMRTNWQSAGLSGLFDWAHVVDPADTGKWNADGTPGTRGAGFPIMAGRTISSVALGSYIGVSSGGVGYPINSNIPCVVRPYPGDNGAGGGVVTAAVGGGGIITRFDVITPGDYQFPPMVAPTGAWTNDGVHGNPRSYNEIIYGCGISPQMFSL
jgi:hypothetical protein